MPITTSPDAAPRPRRRPARMWLTETEILGLIAVHIPLAFVLQRVPFVSTLHALAVFAIGLLFLGRDRSPERVIATIAMVCGSEVMWRGTRAAVFWEFGKYASVALALLALFRYSHQRRRTETSGALYAALMLPSLLVLPYFSRSEVAFNISGPFALGLLALSLSGFRIEPRAVRTALAAMLAPLVGLGALSAFSTLQVDDFAEVHIGGKATTAGIGPNQVSAALGLGAVLAVLLILMVRRRSTRGALALAALWLLAQTMLSLSRGGFWTAVGALGVASVALLRDRRQRGIVLGAALVLVPAFQYLVFPAIDAYTGGLVGARFSDERLTGRDKIIQADLMTFEDHAVLGVGPGQSKYAHESTFRVASAHTEYSRLLAEHGAFGIGAMLLLVVMGVHRLRVARHPLQLAIGLAFCVWTALYMGHSAMRLVAPATLFALAGMGWSLPADAPATAPARRRRVPRPVAGAWQPRTT